MNSVTRAIELLAATLLKTEGISPEALNEAGELCHVSEQKDLAFLLFHQAVLLDPAHISALNNLGVTYFERGRHDMAAHCFREALRFDPQNPEAIMNLDALPVKRRVSIVMAVHNSVSMTERCLMAIARNTPHEAFELIIVDDASTDLTPQFLSALDGDVTVITNPGRMGYAKSLNIGAQRAGGNVIVFMSNEVEPLEGWLQPLVDELDANATTAVVATRLLSKDGLVFHAGYGIGDDQLPHNAYRGLSADDARVSALRQCPAVSLACAAVRRGEFYAMGMLDARASDAAVDMCLRYQRGAMVSVCEPRSQAIAYPLQEDIPEPAKIPVPPKELRFMGESEEAFLSIGDGLVHSMVEIAGLRPGDSVFDIGSGYGRVAHALMRAGWFKGGYEGMDILKNHVAWCQDSIGALSPRYRFQHLNVLNKRYNPHGTVDPSAVVFPYSDNAFDRVCLFSVFTHMYEKEILHYLSEIKRMLRPGGTCLCTFFIFDDASLKSHVDGSLTHSLVFEVNPHCRYKDAKDPLFMIGYDEPWLRAQLSGLGFEISDIRRGQWTGNKDGYSFQDMAVIKKPGPDGSADRPTSAALASPKPVAQNQIAPMVKYITDQIRNIYPAFIEGAIDVHNKDVLLFGAGSGTEIIWCLQQGARSIFATDISPMPSTWQLIADEMGIAWQDKVRTGKLDICSEHLDMQFDVIMGINCWEHLPDIHGCLKHSLEMLKDGAMLFIFTAPFFWSSLGPHLRRFYETEQWVQLRRTDEEIKELSTAIEWKNYVELNRTDVPETWGAIAEMPMLLEEFHVFPDHHRMKLGRLAAEFYRMPQRVLDLTVRGVRFKLRRSMEFERGIAGYKARTEDNH